MEKVPSGTTFIMASPTTSKMRFPMSGSPPPSLIFVTLPRLYIDARYWEHKSEVSRQTKLSANPSTSKYTPDKPSIPASASSYSAAPKDTKESKGKATNTVSPTSPPS